jgi:ATP-binding cassette subfamily F protein 3
MIRTDKLSLTFAHQTIFDNLSFLLQDDQRVGLVGRNGSGKSTLLKMLAGQQEPTSGSITRSNNLSIAYLSQDITLDSKEIVIDEVLAEHAHLDGLELPRKRAEAYKILSGLGLSHELIESPINTLSVGWKMRVVLAQLLLKNADFYFFDEPTNHLDIVAKDWFLNFLKKAPFGFLLVCHERYMLDELCDYTLALENKNGKLYQGNYTEYKTKSSAEQAILRQTALQQQKIIEKKEAVIARFKSSAARGSMAQSMMKELGRMERVELPPEPPVMAVTLPTLNPSGKQVLTVQNVSYAFSGRTIFDHISCSIERGEKVALIAANGVGKTTLLHIIAQEIALQKGAITLGHNVQFAMFHQDQNAVLTHKNTILQEVEESAGLATTTAAIRSVLGAFLFSAEDVYKKVGVLSGGEKGRVGLVKLLLKKANFLILDEPTNHLDIESKEMLLDALKKYQGTILFVSHDHDFINNLATRILELTPHGVHSYTGNYNDYLYQKQFVTPADAKEKPVQAQKNSQSASVLDKEDLLQQTKKIEAVLARLEKEKTKVTEELFDHEYGTPEFSERYNRITEIDKQHAKLLSEWTEIQSKLEELSLPPRSS